MEYQPKDPAIIRAFDDFSNNDFSRSLDEDYGYFVGANEYVIPFHAHGVLLHAWFLKAEIEGRDGKSLWNLWPDNEPDEGETYRVILKNRVKGLTYKTVGRFIDGEWRLHSVVPNYRKEGIELYFRDFDD